MNRVEIDIDVIEGLVAFSLLMGAGEKILEKSPVRISKIYEKCLRSLAGGQRKSLKDGELLSILEKWRERWNKKGAG